MYIKPYVVYTAQGDYYFDKKDKAENFAKIRNGYVELTVLRKKRQFHRSFYLMFIHSNDLLQNR